MIRDCNRVKRLQWVKETLGDDFSEYIFSDETTFQKVTKGSTALKLELSQDVSPIQSILLKSTYGQPLAKGELQE